jgi:hypothetical protein
MLRSRRTLFIIGIGALLISSELLVFHSLNSSLNGFAHFLGTLAQKTAGVVDLASAAAKLAPNATDANGPLHAEDIKSKSLSLGVLQALARDEKEYCDQFSGSYRIGCKQTFRANLLWDELVVSPQGRTAILVENRNMGACGSAGCALYLFLQRKGTTFIQVFGAYGEVGSLHRVKVLKSVSGGYYDIQKTWRDGKEHTTYRWDGQHYSADSPVSAPR